jgi:rhodanese-related sulfurtransferase
MLSAIKNMFKTNYENLNGTEFKKRYESSPDAVLLDVRTAREVAEYSLKGHKHIDIMSAAFPEEISKLHKDKAYFVYCRSGNRSGQACNYMASQGFTKLYNLSGGVGEYPKN